MINKALLYVLLFLFVTPLSASNNTSSDTLSLAKQCQILAVKLDHLVEEQTDDLCEIILDDASYNVEMAGTSIVNLHYSAAKFSLQTAIKELKAAENLDCENRAEISLFINQTSQINSQISD